MISYANNVGKLYADKTALKQIDDVIKSNAAPEYQKRITDKAFEMIQKDILGIR